MTRLRFVLRLNPSKMEAGNLASYGSVTFAPMDALADGLGGLDLSLERAADELSDCNYSYFAEGDILLAKVTPCFENGKKALVTNLPSRIGFATSEVHVIRSDPKKIDSNYLRYLLSSEKFRAAGIASMTGAGGLRRISDNAIKNFQLPITDLNTQRAIATFLDRETGKIERTIAKMGGSDAARVAAKGSLLSLLVERRSALITLAVTGQLEINEKLAAISTPERSAFRTVVTAEIIHQHQNNAKFGRVKLQKELYLAEAHVGISELQGCYMRQAAGPLDRSLIEESERAVEAAEFYHASQQEGAGTMVAYAPLGKAGQHKTTLNNLLGERIDALRNLILLLRDFDTESVEAIATLYAVWNDALIDGQHPDDDAVIYGVLTEWHAEKGKRFKDSDLRHWLDWMKRNGLTPSGQGPHTIHTMTKNLFA